MNFHEECILFPELFSHTYISYKNVVIDSSLFSDFLLKKLEKIRKYQIQF